MGCSSPGILPWKASGLSQYSSNTDPGKSGNFCVIRYCLLCCKNGIYASVENVLLDSWKTLKSPGKLCWNIGTNSGSSVLSTCSQVWVCLYLWCTSEIDWNNCARVTMYSVSRKSSPPHFLRYFLSRWTCVIENYLNYCPNIFLHLHQFWSICLNICVKCIIFTGETLQILRIHI